jgi:hypothetical protein
MGLRMYYSTTTGTSDNEWVASVNDNGSSSVTV